MKRIESIDVLWERHLNGDIKVLEDLVTYYQPLVKKTALIVSRGLPKHLELDDFISDGNFGLLDALSRFDPSSGYKFETYASFRIRGEILDKLRKADWAPRTLRSKIREIDAASESLSADLGREPHPEEIAEVLAIPVEDVYATLSESSLSNVANLDDITVDGTGMTFADLVPQIEPLSFEEDWGPLLERLMGGFSTLSEKQLTVLSLYYIEGLPLKDIGNLLSVTESRACQLHTRALDHLRESCRP